MQKWMNLIFCIAFLLCICLPLLCMDHETNKKSDIDNAYLPELADIQPDNFSEGLDEYVSKRIGFRKESLFAYVTINDRIFNRLEHPIYMYGKDGHIFFKGSPYIRSYQHMNLDEAGAEEFAASVQQFQAYCQSRDTDFLYMLIPDKETVYPEYYPDTVNVYGDVSLSDQVLAEMEALGVPYLYTLDAMLEGKAVCPVNNVKYDAGHWNQHGAFYSIRALYQLLRQSHPEVLPIRAEDFEITMENQPYLDTSSFAINELVPVYRSRENNALDETDRFLEITRMAEPNSYVRHYRNPERADQPKLLIFGDSYLAGYDQFFAQHFGEYTYIHRNNLKNQAFFEYYVEQVDPDIVILENPQRTLLYDLDQDASLDDLLNIQK